MREMLRTGYQACRLLLLSSILTGLIYPLFVTGLGQILCPWRATGSIWKNAGSQWIGQYFTADDYFWGRPPSIPSAGYNPLVARGSNSSISSPVYLSLIKARISALHAQTKPIPIELVTASASGLDPDLSPEAVVYQAERVAKARHMPLDQLMTLIQQHIIPRTFGILGEPRINVLALNRALDEKGK